ncbi:SUKH-4 family immunity protein [Kitasatospora sp. NPDC101183]|uniref:SUKH-4 family immunity protein n=1 Tax=Kitasatospora sp. NPDC101183 TaxID=3364100 RepID=UPI003821CF78
MLVSGAFLEFHEAPHRPVGVTVPGVFHDDTPPGPEDRRQCLGESGSNGLITLDTVTGEVRAVEWPGQEAGGELLATSLPALAALVREVEAVASGAADPTARGGRRGTAVADAVIAEAEERMRAIDPALFAAHPRHPHWRTALVVASLPWGARPGGPEDGLAYVFEPDLVESLGHVFDTDDEPTVRRYRPEDLPAELVHAPTRRLLTEVGLPLDVDVLGLPSEGPLTPAPGAEPHHLFLAWWADDLRISLDGTTGAVLVHDPTGGYGDLAPYLNRDLSALLYALWTYERLATEWYHENEDDPRDDSDDETVIDPHALLLNEVDARIEAVDPEAFATPDHSWRRLAEDPYTGGFLCD